MGILIQKTNINTKCFYVSPMSRTSMCVRVRVEHSSILCNGNARGRSSVRSDAASRASTCYRPNQRVSSSVRLLHLSQKYLPTHSPIARFTTPCGRQSAPLRIRRSGHLPPARPHPALLALLALARRAPHLCRQARRPPLMVLVVPSRVSSRSPPSQGHPRAQPVLVVLVRCCSASTPTLRPESTALVSPSHYVANICFKCFHMDVVKVDRDVAYIASVSDACCKCFRGMLQVFVQMFHLFQT
jgi:hypothetical protein